MIMSRCWRFKTAGLTGSYIFNAALDCCLGGSFLDWSDSSTDDVSELVSKLFSWILKLSSMSKSKVPEFLLDT